MAPDGREETARLFDDEVASGLELGTRGGHENVIASQE
jgi:hypothetical protein